MSMYRIFLAVIFSALSASAQYTAFGKPRSAKIYNSKTATWDFIRINQVVTDNDKVLLQPGALLYLYGKDGSLKVLDAVWAIAVKDIASVNAPNAAIKILVDSLILLIVEDLKSLDVDRGLKYINATGSHLSCVCDAPIVLGDKKNWIPFSDTISLRWYRRKNSKNEFTVYNYFEEELSSISSKDTFYVFDSKQYDEPTISVRFASSDDNNSRMTFSRLPKVQIAMLKAEYQLLKTHMPVDYPLANILFNYYFKLRNFNTEYFYRVSGLSSAARSSDQYLCYYIYKETVERHLVWD